MKSRNDKILELGTLKRLLNGFVPFILDKLLDLGMFQNWRRGLHNYNNFMDITYLSEILNNLNRVLWSYIDSIKIFNQSDNRELLMTNIPSMI